MLQRKLSRATDQRMALIRNQVSMLLWHGQIETTAARAKEISREADKILTLAINSYQDVEKKIETRLVTGTKGKNKQPVKVEQKVEVINDGPKKLAARRNIMGRTYDIPEMKKDDETKASFRQRTGHIKHPLVEKIFNEYAPKYDQRREELGQGGGYTRVLKTGFRRGDATEMAIIELV